MHFFALAMLGFAAAASARNAEDEARLCGIDPQHSTFHTAHYAGGDVSVTVPIDADGNPLVALNPGAVASRVIASGKVEKSIFPKQPLDPEVLPMAVGVRVTCYPDGSSVVVTVPISEAEPYPPIVAKALGKPIPPPANYALDRDKTMNAISTAVELSTITIEGYRHSYRYARRYKAEPRDWVLVRDEIVCEKGDACWAS